MYYITYRKQYRIDADCFKLISYCTYIMFILLGLRAVTFVSPPSNVCDNDCTCNVVVPWGVQCCAEHRKHHLH